MPGSRLVKLDRDTLGKNAKARLLRDYKTMNQSKGMKFNTPMKKVLDFTSDYGTFETEEYLYDELVKRYNEDIDEKQKARDVTRKQTRKDQRLAKKEELARRKEASRERTFILKDMKYRGTYYKTYYDFMEDKRFQPGEVQYWEKSTYPITTTNVKASIANYLEREVVYDDGYKIIELLGYIVDIMDTRELTNNQLPRERQPMRRSYVLRNDWLKYSHGIAEYAYDQTDGMCVYHCGVAGKSGYGTSVVIIYYIQWKEWNGMEDIMAPTATRS